MIAVFDWLLAHWFLIFLLGVFGVFDWFREFVTDVAKALGGGKRSKREKRLERRVRELETAQAGRPVIQPAPKPGPCVHRQVKPVISVDEKLVAWLCACGEQLPAEWAVREEDL